MVQRRLSPSGLYLLAFVAWQVCAIPLYHAEWKGSQIAARLYHTKDQDRRAYADGPVYLVLQTALELVPPESRVVFVNPATEAEGAYYEGKVKYYLWPRRLGFVTVEQAADVRSISNVDAILLFDPRNVPADLVASLDALPSMKKVFEMLRGRTYQAVYLKRH